MSTGALIVFPAQFGSLADSFRFVNDTRHVILPKPMLKLLPKTLFDPTETGCLRILTEEEWRGIGITQSLGWEHYEVHGTTPFSPFSLSDSYACVCRVPWVELGLTPLCGSLFLTFLHDRSHTKSSISSTIQPQSLMFSSFVVCLISPFQTAAPSNSTGLAREISPSRDSINQVLPRFRPSPRIVIFSITLPLHQPPPCCR